MRTSSKRCLFLHTLEESRSRNHALILIFQTCSRVVIYTHTSPSFHCFPSLICVFTEICKTRFRSSGQSFREDHQSPRNEINYSIATCVHAFSKFLPSNPFITFDRYYHSPFVNSLSVSERTRSRRAITVLITRSSYFDYTLLHIYTRVISRKIESRLWKKLLVTVSHWPTFSTKHVPLIGNV